VRASIKKNIGVPVSVGIAPSKTLAKLAAEIGKTQDRYEGVFSFIGLDEETRHEALNSIPVGDVWGVGWRLSPRLKAEGVGTAWALAQLRPQYAQQIMGVHGRQLVSELNGTACHGLSRELKSAQSILRSRTFGEDPWTTSTPSMGKGNSSTLPRLCAPAGSQNTKSARPCT
jgi:DNA polymerase V